MALRTVREAGDPVLTKKCKEIKEMTPRLKALADDMLETMYEENGVGLAAPQVGILRRLVVIDCATEETPDDGPFVLVNPVITESDGSQTGDEGCLSVPGKVGTVTRPEHVVCEAFDRDMKPLRIDAHGLLARAICHELDHLEGVLYTEKAEGGIRDVRFEDDEE